MEARLFVAANSRRRFTNTAAPERTQMGWQPPIGGPFNKPSPSTPAAVFGLPIYFLLISFLIASAFPFLFYLFSFLCLPHSQILKLPLI